MTRSSAASITLACAMACGSENQVPASPRTANEATPDATSAPIVIELGAGKVRASVPSHFVPMPAEERQRIEASRTGTSGASMESVAYVAAPGTPPGAAYVAEIQHRDRTILYGETLSSFATFSLLGTVAALERETGRPLKSTPTPNETGRFVDLLARTQEGEPGGVWMRSRVFAPSASSVVERICFCTGAGCDGESLACEFAPAPADAIGIDEPLHAGGPPTLLALAGTGAKVSAPPFYEAQPKTALAEWSTAMTTSNPEVRVVAAVSRASPGSHDHWVRLARLSRCRSGKTCRAKAIAEAMVADVDTAEPGTLAELHLGDDTVEVELTARGTWERRAFFDHADGVTELRCACAGAGCLVAAGSCELRVDADGSPTD